MTKPIAMPGNGDGAAPIARASFPGLLAFFRRCPCAFFLKALTVDFVRRSACSPNRGWPGFFCACPGSDSL